MRTTWGLSMINLSLSDAVVVGCGSDGMLESFYLAWPRYVSGDMAATLRIREIQKELIRAET